MYMISHFSIIIPVYNVAPYLRECLDSVLAQTFASWEAICVDDGSTDGSGRILDEYAGRDSRFKVRHKENGGVASARNLGLDIATGDWIAFLDADDVWASWTLEYVNRAIGEAEGVDLVRFDTTDFQEGWRHPFDATERAPYVSELEDVSRRIDPGSVTCFFWGKVYRRDLVDGIKFENYKVGEDLLFLAQCLARAKMQMHVKACCYGYRQRSGSASHSGASVRTQGDELGYIPKILQTYDLADKIVDKTLWRSYTNKLTEQFAMSQFNLAKGARKELWRKWRENLSTVVRLKKLPRFQKIRICILLALPFSVVAYLLCVVPCLMKVKWGIHR